MTDTDSSMAQRIHWEIVSLERQGITGRPLRARHRKAADLYHRIAKNTVPHGDIEGWSDVFAAITHYGEAGDAHDARRLLTWARDQCSKLEEPDAILAELNNLETWLTELRVTPSLSAFARSLPPLPELAA